MTTPTERSSSSSPDSPLGDEASTVLSGSAVSGADGAGALAGGPGEAVAEVTWSGLFSSPPG